MQNIKKWIRILPLMLAVVLTISTVNAQDAVIKTPPKDWQLLDLQQDSIYGASVIKAYQDLLKGKPSHTVIVAVIDGGVDTAQEDLKGLIWTNPGEIPGNGIDDDHNGYVDDVHGWNFLGGKDGRSIVNESSEQAREYFRLSKKYDDVTDSSTVKDKKEYREWLKLKAIRSQDSVSYLKDKFTYETVSNAIEKFSEIDSILRSTLNKDSVYAGDVQEMNADSTDFDLMQAKEIATRVFNNIGPDVSFEEFLSQGKEYLVALQSDLQAKAGNFKLTDPNAQRREIVGDNPDDINDRDYGNNNITNNDDPMYGSHGTHVSGIIAATRGNNIGMDGIANNVIIMPIKVVPNGDERDKDVALGIRYAVDNGAQIINMSFGKGYSPGKQWVDDAVKYADEKGVLLVHAAGNENSDDDSVGNFPNADFEGSDKRATNFINVGASASGVNGKIVAYFSNYGKKDVDLFAPGVQIYSTIPGNKYEAMSGTSMASPVVSGIAALILEYYPKLSAEQLKYVIDHSAMQLPGKMVDEPGTNEKVEFSSLSESGGIVNAYNALKLAATLKGDRKIPKHKKKKHESLELQAKS